MRLLPPPELCARLDARVFQRAALHHLPDLEVVQNLGQRGLPRRDFLKAATLGLAAFSSVPGLAAVKRPSAEPLIFSPDPTDAPPAPQPQEAPVPQPALRRGEIPSDFWQRPRELWLRRQGTNDEIRAVYWKDGQIHPEGYWRICAMLRDVRANLMTTVDPVALDILRGVLGYYEAWQWPYPLVVTSGYRTVATNNALLSEGAARNSMHLYGKAVDLYIPGIPARDIASLGLYLRQGGVGFYPGKGFTHLDTGRLRFWQGR